MKTIIAATDFSKAAENACMYAADMAQALNADLVLVHFWHFPVTFGEMPLDITENEIVEGAKRNMASLEQQLTSKLKGKVAVSSKISMGEFFTELEAIGEQLKPYAVVMGSQGTTASERIIFGGHAVHAMKNLHWPLITVPPGSFFNTIKNIGIACDFHNVANIMPVDEIKTLVRDFNAALHIINTGKKESYDPELVFQSGVLQEMLADLKPVFHFVTNKDTDEGIIEFARQNKIDLLIVLPKRHGLLDKLLHKSHTKQLVLHSHVPVMALHE